MVGMFIDIQHKKECRFQDTNLQKKRKYAFCIPILEINEKKANTESFD